MNKSQSSKPIVPARTVLRCTVCGTKSTSVRVFDPQNLACAACTRLILAIHA